MPRPVRNWLMLAFLLVVFFVTLHYTVGVDNFTAGIIKAFPWTRDVHLIPIRIFWAPYNLTVRGILSLFPPPTPVIDFPGYGLIVLFFGGIYSWVFWWTALPRFWKLIGRWDPFGWNSFEMRPYHLNLWVNMTGWWEREREFGQHATGGFAGLIEVLSNRFKDGDIYLGRPKLMKGGMLRPIGIPTEKHMVTIAGTGSGKSTGALIPNLCLHSGSLLCVDPKGELALITARRRGDGGGGVRGLGQKVFVLDPFGFVKGFTSASYNVFDEMARVAEYDAERPVSYARKVAQALVPSSSKEPYWDDAPRTFISGLLLHILQGPPAQRNLVRLRQLIMEGDTEAYQKLAAGRDKGDAFDALLVMMKNSPAGPYHHVIAGAASSLSMMAPNQRGSVMSMAMEHTSFLDMPELRRISLKSDFLLEDLKGEDHISVYLCLPLNAVSGIEARWLRLFVMLTVDMMTRVNKAPKPPLLLALDEFPSLGKLDGIEAVAPTMRSQGVRLWVIGQDIEQFEKVYPDSWGSFIGGAEAVQFMGVTHPPTVAYIAERLGQHVVREWQRQGNQRRQVVSERPVRDPEQIARLLSPDSRNQIVWRGNKRPLLLKITPYFSYMPWWYYSRDPRHPQKLRQWFWRRGSDGPVVPPGPPYIPPKPPVEPPPPDPPKGEDFSWPPPVKTAPIREAAAPVLPPAATGGAFSGPYFPPAEPGVTITPADTVPGTTASWREALAKQAERVVKWAEGVQERQDQRVAEEKERAERNREYMRNWSPSVPVAPVKETAEKGPEERPGMSKQEQMVRESAEGQAAFLKRMVEASNIREKVIIPDAGEKPVALPLAEPGPAAAPVKKPVIKTPKPGPVKPPGPGGPGGSDALLAELDGLIGLDAVKKQVRKTVALVRLGQQRDQAGLKHLDLTHHLVFTGNPGTGKTTVARIVGRIYKEIGLLKSGHMVEAECGDLIAGFLGQTATKTRAVIDGAMDGVLFIDEAYGLAPQDGKGDFGAAAVATLLTAMENDRDRLVVIVAGYKDEMGHFIDSNPGLKSRFKTFIEFEDYSSAELFRILTHMASEAGIRFSSDAMIAAAALMESQETGTKGFGNGRTVRNIFEECLARMAGRLADGRARVDVTMFEPDDIPRPGEMIFS